MKKSFYLIIALMLALTITGCSTKESNTVAKEKKQAEEKISKDQKEEKKEEKKETTKDNKINEKEETKEDDKKDQTISDVSDMLTCETKSDSYNGVVDFIWSAGNLKEIDYKIVVLIDDQNMTDDLFDATVELTKQTLISTYGIDENTEGVTFKTEANKEEKTITFYIYADLKAANKENLEKLGLNLTEEDLKANIDIIKVSMEQNNFTCEKRVIN